MSPLWRDEIAIYLAPSKLVLVRRARGVRPRVVAATELGVTAGTAGDIGPVLARLADVLTEATWQGAAARAVVADHPWARYAIVPWPATRLDAAGHLTQARYVLGDAHGDAVADWAVSLSESPPGQPYVACAMPAALRGALEDVLAPANLALVSLQPQLIAAFNTWRRRLPADDAWFVTLDDGALCAVHLAGGAWDRVHTARLSPDWRVELERLQAFARLTRANGALVRMFVDGPAWMRRDAAAAAGIEWLAEDDRPGAQTHQLALLQRESADVSALDERIGRYYRVARSDRIVAVLENIDAEARRANQCAASNEKTVCMGTPSATMTIAR